VYVIRFIVETLDVADAWAFLAAQPWIASALPVDMIPALVSLLFLSDIASATRGVATTPPMGWSSWTSFACSVTGADLANASDIMVSSGLAKHYNILHVDDCWMLQSANRSAGGIGHQTPNPSKFPDGIESVI